MAIGVIAMNLFSSSCRLLAYRRGKTTITITHRPSVIDRAEWIILIEDGLLKLQGSPQELRSHSDSQLNFFLTA
jgi:ATP-binding cassette, subfamily C, bacterial